MQSGEHVRHATNRNPSGRLLTFALEADVRFAARADDTTTNTTIIDVTVTAEPPTRLFLGTDVFDLTETDEGVRVRITRAPRGANPDRDAYYDDITEGWRTFLHQLKWAVERHPGQERVTHFTAGTPHRPGPIVRALGPAEIAARPIGSDFAVTLPAGTPISGTVFFRTEHRFGITVTQWGDGLLMVADSPPAPHRPVAGSAASSVTLPGQAPAAS